MNKIFGDETKEVIPIDFISLSVKMIGKYGDCTRIKRESTSHAHLINIPICISIVIKSSDGNQPKEFIKAYTINQQCKLALCSAVCCEIQAPIFICEIILKIYPFI